MNDELRNLLSKPTADIPDVGRVCFELSRNGSYDAAKRGDLGEIIKVGRLQKVITSTLRAKLGLEAV
jgi:hypothetical protein